ncbi:hypothetical protein [uncultured Methanolobus sp.]|uniref:hypothetical protein n=1 Tax=uncultured Methanolobus sp. TaxID=218300 RepID=UPI0029C86361|nr:hypothetical protein [uncultured Methanolobus sp.]
MSNNDDFSWKNGKITTGNTLGKIVSIPLQEDSDIEIPEEIKTEIEDNTDLVIDEFKEKMAEVLSRELHKK